MTAEGISPFRWWLIRSLTRSEEFRFLYHPATWPAGHERVYAYDREGLQVASFIWRVCRACRQGVICKISISGEVQRRGLGRRFIRRACGGHADYVWGTSGQSPDGARFFRVMSAETGHQFTQGVASCEHLRSSRPLESAGALSRAHWDRTV